MKSKVSIQIIDYAGAQKSAVLGIRDLLNYASLGARIGSPPLFEVFVVEGPDRRSDFTVFPPALSLSPPCLPKDWRDALIRHHRSGMVLCSVCSGAFLLAQTGLLDGRRVTTHWQHASAFRSTFPQVVVDTDSLLVDQGDIVTAGGVMAWTDLTLHLIERTGGRALMIDVAKMFVLDPPDREQSYYATFAPDTAHPDRVIAGVQLFMAATVSNQHSIETLAGETALSERSFLRRFKAATGMSPISYLQSLRIEAARSRLELTRDSVQSIAWDVGYSDLNSFRQLFRRIVGLTPSEYRRIFGLRP